MTVLFRCFLLRIKQLINKSSNHALHPRCMWARDLRTWPFNMLVHSLLREGGGIMQVIQTLPSINKNNQKSKRVGRGWSYAMDGLWTRAWKRIGPKLTQNWLPKASKWAQVGSEIEAWRVLEPTARTEALRVRSRDSFGHHLDTHLGAHWRQNSL